VRLQLCDFCLKSGIYCNKCQSKLQSGVVDQLYVESAKLLMALENRYQILRKIRLDNVVRINTLRVLMIGRGGNRLLKSSSDLVREIRNLFNSRVLIIESGTSNRQFLEELLADQRIITVNTVWLPGETSETRVILDRHGARRLGKRRLRELTQVSKKVRNIDLRIDYTN
jgi:transcription antitermination factor NusA-like protein